MGVIELMRKKGAHILVDGQFGSTGKGLLASYLAEKAWDADIDFDVVVTSAGPNSGHTFYHKGEKIVLKMLPSFAVKTLCLINDMLEGSDSVSPPTVYFSAGAILNFSVLHAEMRRFPGLTVIVHPNAAVITDEDVKAEHSGSIAAVAGTRSGTGAALARKVYREPEAVARYYDEALTKLDITVDDKSDSWDSDCRAFVEVSQGFSLGINSQFYPKVTSRECTVMQAMADARMPLAFHAATYMSIRTYPIRVGNFEGHSSGDCYEDQREVRWEDVGVEPELTTVTQRERRIFSFSKIQFLEAMWANDPQVVFVNFMNYLPAHVRSEFMQDLCDEAPDGTIWLQGFGPRNEDVDQW